MVRRIANASAFLIGLALLAGCASRPINPPRAAFDRSYGYRTETANARPGTDPDTIMALAFSGGGTRAAAFAFGVLEELRRTQIVVAGKARPLLSEVDIIAGVSGGSITALAYALHGDRLFEEFDRRFLKRDVQGDLIARALSPAYWGKLSSEGFGRSELAADYYDEILFERATFGDLVGRDAPHVIVTGTDLSTGGRFEFVQGQFDAICSDLSQVRLSRAAATSSAVPVMLSPVTFNNYAGSCGFRPPDFIEALVNPAQGQRPPARFVERHREFLELQDSVNRPYLHIVDGGISDNLALRGILEGLEGLEHSPAFRELVNMRSFRRVVVIVVNARSGVRTGWNKSETPPGTLSILLQATGVPIDRYSYESLEHLKETVERWNSQREVDLMRRRLFGSVDETPLELKLYAIDVSFAAVADPQERDFLMNLPTSFALSDEAVDRLRSAAGAVLRASAPFRDLVRDMGGEVPP